MCGSLKGRTGELPADHGLGSSGCETGAAPSAGQLAPPLDASRQPVILLRTHSPLTNSYYCYNNTSWPVSLGVSLESLLGPASPFERRQDTGKAPMFRLIGYATGAPPETRGDLHPSFCKDRSVSRDQPCPKYDAPATAGDTADRGMGGPLRNLASGQRDAVSALRQNAAAKFLGPRLTALANPTHYCNPHVN